MSITQQRYCCVIDVINFFYCEN